MLLFHGWGPAWPVPAVDNEGKDTELLFLCSLPQTRHQQPLLPSRSLPYTKQLGCFVTVCQLPKATACYTYACNQPWWWWSYTCTCIGWQERCRAKGRAAQVMWEGLHISGCDTAESLEEEKKNMLTGMQLLCLLMGCSKSQRRTGSLYQVLRGSKIVGTLTRTFGGTESLYFRYLIYFWLLRWVFYTWGRLSHTCQSQRYLFWSVMKSK